MEYDLSGIQQRNPFAEENAMKMAASIQRQTQPVRDKSLMDVEFDNLRNSIGELDASVSEVLARIAPVCQPSGLERGEGAQDGAAKQIEATPSDLRSKLMSLRLRVEAISRAIAPVKFRIEI